MLSNCGTGEDSWESLGPRGSNQSILKEINSKYSLEGLLLKLHTLATWCKQLTHWKRLWCWERLRAGGEVDRRGWMVEWHHWLNGHEFEQTQGDSEGQRSLASQRVRHDWAIEQLALQADFQLLWLLAPKSPHSSTVFWNSWFIYISLELCQLMLYVNEIL